MRKKGRNRLGPALLKVDLVTSGLLPRLPSVAAEAAVSLLRLSDVPAGLAANRLAESTRLEEFLLASGERETLSTVPAGQFLVLGHLLTPLKICLHCASVIVGLSEWGLLVHPRVPFTFCRFLSVRSGDYRPSLPNARSHFPLYLTFGRFKSKSDICRKKTGGGASNTYGEPSK